MFEASEDNGFAKDANDVKKIVAKLEWPLDQGKGVNDRARPEDENDAQPCGHIKKGRPIVQRQSGARVLRQNSERNTLDNAGKGEFNVNDVGVELVTGKIHARIKWRAWRDSNLQPSDPKSEALSG